MNRQHRVVSVALVAVLLAGAPTLLAADDPATDKASVEGRWIRQQQTPVGMVTVVKEHRDGTTTLTAYDSDRKVRYAKTSRHTLDTVGGIQLLTFFDNRFTAGPNAGRVDKTRVTFIYRMEKDRLIEARGLGSVSNGCRLLCERKISRKLLRSERRPSPLETGPDYQREA